MIKKLVYVVICISLLTAALCGCARTMSFAGEKSTNSKQAISVSTTVKTASLKTISLSSKKETIVVSDETRNEVAIGQLIGLKSGAKYWSSAYGFGSGKNGIFNAENEYLKSGDYHINGIAVIDYDKFQTLSDEEKDNEENSW